MKNKLVAALTLTFLLTLAPQFTTLLAQGTAFTYQGKLNVSGNPANGSYDLRFTLFNATANGTAYGALTNTATGVTNGLFTATLDFGSIFAGTNYWLEIAARANGNGAFITLSPRQPLTPSPSALYSATAGNANTATIAASANSVSGLNITGTIADSRLSTNVALLNGSPIFSGTVSANAFAGRGVLSYQTVEGTAQIATPNVTYLLTNAAPTVVALPTAAVAGDVVRVMGNGAGGWQVQADLSQSLLGANTNFSIGESWIAHENNRYWYAVASSDDGNKLVALNPNGQIYTSTDSGVNWFPRATNRYWFAIASSADGSKLVAVVLGGQIYTSADSGVNWTARESDRSWCAVASSANGNKLIAETYNGQIFTSTNAGVNWTASVNNLGGSEGGAVASSADGVKLAAVRYGDQIYTSTDSGGSWTPRGFYGPLSSVASSADGSKLVAAVIGGWLYTSIDSGVSWTPRESERSWYSVASSADGSKLVAGDYGGLVYTSTDSGVNWTAHDTNRLWNSFASSANGTKLVAAIIDGQIYTSVNAFRFIGANGTASSFQYLGNNVWQAVVEAVAGSVAATNLSGTITDAQLSTNVALRSGGNTFNGNQTFTNGTVTARGTINAIGGLIIENRTSDPASPATGQIWIRTDLP